MSKEDKKRREALLAQYGYDLDLVVEGENGEEEIMYTGEGGGSSRSSIGSGGGFDKNRNAEAVKQAEQLRRQQLADAHAQEKMRNKLALEKQRADQEKKSKGTQKREKRRM